MLNLFRRNGNGQSGKDKDQEIIKRLVDTCEKYQRHIEQERSKQITDYFVQWMQKEKTQLQRAKTIAIRDAKTKIDRDNVREDYDERLRQVSNIIGELNGSTLNRSQRQKRSELAGHDLARSLSGIAIAFRKIGVNAIDDDTISQARVDELANTSIDTFNKRNQSTQLLTTKADHIKTLIDDLSSGNGTAAARISRFESNLKGFRVDFQARRDGYFASFWRVVDGLLARRNTKSTYGVTGAALVKRLDQMLFKAGSSKKAVEALAKKDSKNSLRRS